MVVAEPAVRLLFERGRFTAHDSQLTAVSTAIYATAIWAFSMQQVLNRAFYALHDMRTPLWTTGANLVVNLVVEIPLLWTHLGESAMAVGTAVSFALQSMLMLYLLRKRVGPLGLSKSVRPLTTMIVGTGLMWVACIGVRHSPIYPHELGAHHKVTWAVQLTVLMTTGAVVYLGVCMAMGINVLEHVRRKKKS